MKYRFGFSEKVLLFLAIVVALQVWWFFRVRQTPEQKLSACARNLNEIALATLLYARDADEKLPPIQINSSQGWSDLIRPYLKKSEVFQCPSTQETKQNTIDYFLNKRVSALSLDKMNYPATTILCGDGNDDSPTWSSWLQLPPDVVNSTTSPAQRHQGIANYACVDGHVVRLRPQFVDNHPLVRSNAPSFAWH